VRRAASTRVTGERVSTPAAGFNPTWQRHVAAYELCAAFLGPGRVLDLGCGVGHSAAMLAPRESVGVDVDPTVLRGQPRETHVADMRALPFPNGSFSSVLAVQSIEHVPDPDRALREVARVLEPGGVTVLVTPNRLTFGRPDEIIDPYHFVEYDPTELGALASRSFADVHLHGLFGSSRVQMLLGAERRKMDRLLALDILRVRRALPRRFRQHTYDLTLQYTRRRPSPPVLAIDTSDYTLASRNLPRALDLVAVCRRGQPFSEPCDPEAND